MNFNARLQSDDVPLLLLLTRRVYIAFSTTVDNDFTRLFESNIRGTRPPAPGLIVYSSSSENQLRNVIGYNIQDERHIVIQPPPSVLLVSLFSL
jgi:hypothetical protein